MFPSSPRFSSVFFPPSCASSFLPSFFQVLRKVSSVHIWLLYYLLFGSEVKASARDAGDLGSIPGSGRSPGEGNGNPLQYSCLENPMDRGAWWATIHGVAKSQTRLSDFTFTGDLCTMRREEEGVLISTQSKICM